MTIEEAISHAREVAEANSCFDKGIECNLTRECKACAEEHEQLAEWLEELKFLRTAKETMYKEIYDKGYADAIEEFNEYLLKHKKLVREIETNYVYESVKIEFIIDTSAEQLKEQKNE